MEIPGQISTEINNPMGCALVCRLHIVEQDHRAVKRVTRPALGFKSFRSAAATLAGTELMHMIRKVQSRTTGELRPAKQFYSLAA
jgi:putative transposase